MGSPFWQCGLRFGNGVSVLVTGSPLWQWDLCPANGISVLLMRSPFSAHSWGTVTPALSLSCPACQQHVGFVFHFSWELHGLAKSQKLCKQIYRFFFFSLLHCRAVTAVFMFAQHEHDCDAVTRKLGAGSISVLLSFFLLPFFFK